MGAFFVLCVGDKGVAIMRTIKNLFIHGNTVWLYFASDDVRSTFLSDAREEGFHLPPDFCDCVCAVHSDMTINYVGFAGHARLNGNDNNSGVRIVDYGKYVAGEDAYFYQRANQ